MNRTQLAAGNALDAVVSSLTDSGATAALQKLTQDVWASNVDRFEPDDLGDTPASLGFQAYQNFTRRALRRASGDPREAPEKHWSIDGLVVTTPSNVLTLNFNGNRIIVMKVPFTQGRQADFSQLAAWENQSDARWRMATRNTQVLGGYVAPAPGQDTLFPTPFPTSGAPGAPGVVRDFILAWAGEQRSGLTAGWLGVPVQGECPFVVSRPLWWDLEADRSNAGSPAASSSTTPFDERAVSGPSITLKPRPAGEGQA